jgi:NADPH:quinone reductase-like Zn-dependent oxidoreductase
MRALVPDQQGSVEIADVEEPIETPGATLIDVRAFSPNRGETFLMSSPLDGWRPGKDVAGVISTAGGHFPLGTRVVAHTPSHGWAERALVPEAAVAVLPESVSFDIAAALPLAGLTALLQTAGSLVGRTLLITGASGGVGHYVVELAVAAGAEVNAVTASLERGARLRELGASIVTDVEQAPGSFNVAMESVGGLSLPAVRRKVRPDGLIIWFGQASLQPPTLDFFDWVGGGAGAPIVQFHYQRTPTQDGRDLRTLVRLTDTDRLHPEIGSTLPWERTADVIAAIRGRSLRGNAVLTITAASSKESTHEVH